MVARWSVLEVQPGDWWAVVTDSGAALQLTRQAGERLWRWHDLLALPLSGAVEADVSQDGLPFVDLEFLGVRARYICADGRMADEVVRLYEGMLPGRRRSPDVLVRIRDTANLDRLHRSVVGPREGVDIRTIDSEHWARGSSELPIIPPLQSPSLAGRFCALHAALLWTESGAALVCGAQRAGKTSAALLAGRLGLASVLAEEMVMVDTRGNALGVPLPVRERTADKREARALARAEKMGDQVKVSQIVILKTTQCSPSRAPVVGTADRMRLIAPHIRVLDGATGRASASVLAMLRDAEVHLWSQREWPELIDDLEQGLRFLLNPRGGD